MATLALNASPSRTNKTYIAQCLDRVREQIRRAKEGRPSISVSRDTTQDHPIDLLRQRFALTTEEETIVWVLIAHELCPTARQLIRDMTTEQVADPTTDALRRIVSGDDISPATWSALMPDGPLRKFALIERSDGANDTPDYRTTWKVSRRVLALVHGVVSLDPGVHGFAEVAGGGACLDQLIVRPGTAQAVADAMGSGRPVILHGPPGCGRRSLLLALAHEKGRRILQIDARAIATDAALARQELAALARECRLLDLTPLIISLDALCATHELRDRIDLVERELPGLVLATSQQPIARRWRSPPILIELAPPTTAQRAQLWHRVLRDISTDDAAQLAAMYPVAPALVNAAGTAALARAGSTDLKQEHIDEGLRTVLDDRLAGLAVRRTTTQTWDDLVLPSEQMTGILELLSRIRERPRVYEDWGFANKVGKGLGVTALFSGPPGTGKSMAAGLIARDLHAPLYQVDLSKVVSKWIGETEKNLAALFDAAESGCAALLFDEADALFGKRTDVKSSHDRHANQEVNYLLQRLETFTGVCILTTNHECAIDDAFRRRLAIHLRFPLPDEAERAHLWRAMLPAAAPVGHDLDLDGLAETYAMSGGHIRNAVVRAAFLAADEGTVIEADHLARAAQLEYEALGKIATSQTSAVRP